MFKRLTLTAFQCHEQLDLGLARITVLIGQNDSGKSAVVRALKWLALNQWDGMKDEFIHWDHKQAMVELVTDKHTITRIKGGGKNLYVLDGNEMLAGIKVPDLVQAAVNMKESNFQNQNDPAFWLMLSNNQAAQALNEIFNLSSIDSALQRIAAEKRQAKTKVVVCKERLLKAKKVKKELDWTTEADAELTKVEMLAKQLAIKSKQKLKLEDRLKQLEEIELVMANASHVIELGELAMTTHERLAKLDVKINQIKRILALEETCQATAKTLKQKETKLKELLKVCPMCGRSSPK